jgi:hypothetical protein
MAFQTGKILGTGLATEPALSDNTDVFVPKLRVLSDELPHEGDAFGLLPDVDVNSVLTEVFFSAPKGLIFADYDARNPIKDDGAAAHGTGREGRINRALPIDSGGPPAGILQAIHFRVKDDAAFLNAAVMPAANDLAFVNQDRTDGYAAFSKSGPCFFDSSHEEWIRAHFCPS